MHHSRRQRRRNPLLGVNTLRKHQEDERDVLMPCCLATAPHAVVIPQPSKHTFSKGAALLTATTETSATTVYCEKVDVPIYIARPQLELPQCGVMGVTHEMVHGLSLDGEAASVIGHKTFALGCTDFRVDCEMTYERDEHKTDLCRRDWSCHSCRTCIHGILVKHERGAGKRMGEVVPAVYRGMTWSPCGNTNQILQEALEVMNALGPRWSRLRRQIQPGIEITLESCISQLTWYSQYLLPRAQE